MPDLATFKRWVDTDYRAHSEWRKCAREAFSFVAGDQWTEEEKQILTDENRVPIVFNRTATIINSVAGSEVNNRTEVRFIPRTMGDAVVNEILTKGAEWFRDQSGAEDEESQAFFDCVVAGLGWTETVLNFEEDPEGAPEMERINPLEMVWDSSAEKRCLSDARRIARVRQIPRSEAIDMFPDADESELNAGWLEKRGMTDEEDEPHRQYSDDDYNHMDGPDVTDDEKDTVTIVQLQYRQRIREVEYVDPMSGQAKTMGKRQFARLMDRMRKGGMMVNIPNRDLTRTEWRQVFIGDEILMENQPCANHATFVPITGYWDNTKREWYGLIRQMKDPQKYANKWLSQTLHIINSNSKGGVFVEEGATDNPREFEENYAAADSVSWLKNGALSQNRVLPKKGVEMPAALMTLTEFAISSIRDVSGVNMELLGLRDENQPGVLEYQRKQAAMTTLATLFDALRQYRKEQGQVMLFYMTEYLADGRLVRIVDEDGARYAPLVIDPGVKKYDVIVDDAPSAPNQKERVWETIMNMMPLLQNAGLPAEVWMELLEYAPFPTSLVEKLRKFAEKGPPPPDPALEKMKALEVAKLEAEVAKTQAEARGEDSTMMRDRANAMENLAQATKYMAEAEGKPLDRQQQLIDMIAKMDEIYRGDRDQGLKERQAGLQEMQAGAQAQTGMMDAETRRMAAMRSNTNG